jgi:hypothetical protein
MTQDFFAPHVGLVVEGAGDRGAVPVLLRKYLVSIGDFRDVLGKPVPAHGRDKALRAGGLEGFVATASSRPGCVGILVVLDGEGDCVAEAGPELLVRSQSTTGKPIAVTLADRDFESWIYASAETIGLGLSFDQAKNGQSAIASAIRPAKYVKPTWQPRLTARMDLDLACGRNAGLARALERFELLRQLVP